MRRFGSSSSRPWPIKKSVTISVNPGSGALLAPWSISADEPRSRIKLNYRVAPSPMNTLADCTLESYLAHPDHSLAERIAGLRARLGTRVLILGHHYQRDEVIRFADYRGDSLHLARRCRQHPEAEAIVFCGVHF